MLLFLEKVNLNTGERTKRNKLMQEKNGSGYLFFNTISFFNNFTCMKYSAISLNVVFVSVNIKTITQTL